MDPGTAASATRNNWRSSTTQRRFFEDNKFDVDRVRDGYHHSGVFKHIDRGDAAGHQSIAHSLRHWIQQQHYLELPIVHD
jgi:hypothetical protein